MRSRWRRFAALLVLLAILAVWAGIAWRVPPEMIDGRALRVHDGDSFLLGQQEVRLAGIDAPEYRQTCTGSDGEDWPCGQAARAALVALLRQGTLTCAVEARDRYDRAIATCRNRAGDIGSAMVRHGMAISPSVRGAARYDDEQADARRARRGLWQGDFTPPADWRASHAILQ